MSTPPIAPPSDGQLICRVANVGQKDVTLHTSIYDLGGNNLGGLNSSVIPPKAVVASSSSNDSARFCVVTIEQGSKASVRAVLEVRDASGNLLATVPAQ
jgi:hypothetical protein